MATSHIDPLAARRAAVNLSRGARAWSNTIPYGEVLENIQARKRAQGIRENLKRWGHKIS